MIGRRRGRSQDAGLDRRKRVERNAMDSDASSITTATGNEVDDGENNESLSMLSQTTLSLESSQRKSKVETHAHADDSGDDGSDLITPTKPPRSSRARRTLVEEESDESDEAPLATDAHPLSAATRKRHAEALDGPAAEPALRASHGTATRSTAPNADGAAAGTATAAETDEAAELERIREATTLFPIEKRLPSGFVPGQIRRVRMYNFMTYSDVQVQPGPGLNLIVGPNGAGKSTIVCALCLGLGGAPSVLGRGDHIGDFIRHGCDEGFVEIDLCGNSDDRPYRIRREMRRTEKHGSSSYKLNGRASTERDVRELVARLHIRVDNLNTFLPQDRVSKFAEARPQELLRQLEEAYGDTEMTQQHQELIKGGEALLRHQQDQATFEKRIADLEVQVEHLQQNMQRFEQRNQLLAQIDKLKRKLPYLRLKAAEQELAGARQREKDATDTLERVTAELQPALQGVERVRAEKGRADTAAAAASQKRTRDRAAVDERQARVSELDEKVSGAQAELDGLEVEKRRAQDKLRDLQTREQQHRDMLAARRPQADIERDIDALSGELEEKSRAESELMDRERRLQQETQALQEQLRQLRDPGRDIMQQFGQHLQKMWLGHALQVLDLIERLRPQLKGPVFGPLCGELRFRDLRACHVINTHVGQNLASAFVFSTWEDRQLVLESMRNHNLRGLTSYVVPREAWTPEDKLRALGVTSSLEFMYEAPEPVKACLRVYHMLDETFDAPSLDERTIGPLLEKHRLGCVYGAEVSVRGLRSRTGRMTLQVNAIKIPRAEDRNPFVYNPRGTPFMWALRQAGSIAEQRAGLQEQLQTQQAELQKLQAERRRASEEKAAVVNRRKQLTDEKRNLLTARRQLEDLRAQVQQAEKAAHRDFEADSQALRAQMAQSYRKRAEAYVLLVAAMQAQVTGYQAYAGAQLRKVQLARQLQVAERGAAAARERLHEAQRAVDTAREVRLQAQRLCKEREKEALKVADFRRPEVMREFAESPDTVEELEDLIAETQHRVNAIIINEQDVHLYEEQRQRLETTRRDLAQSREIAQQRAAEVQALRTRWEGRLRPAIKRVGVTFRRFFATLGCQGEVHLSIPPVELNFADWGIDIRVSFRAGTELQSLSLKFSGGERAVSTMLFLMALQGVLPNPFRVVDEINQGMDPENEKRVMGLLVKEASQPDMPQYFVVTPKLLPHLVYPKRAVVHVVFNGPFMLPQQEWNTQQVIEETIRYTRRQAGAD